MVKGMEENKGTVEGNAWHRGRKGKAKGTAKCKVKNNGIVKVMEKGMKKYKSTMEGKARLKARKK